MALTGQQFQDYGRAYIADAYRSIYGRDPTEAEIAEAFPSLGHDPNIHDIGSLKAFVGQKYQLEQNNPATIYQKQQQQWQQQAPQHANDVTALVKSLYGRDATKDELNHYGTLLASGQADPYQIQQFLMATPEYQNAQDKTFREGVNTQLQDYDTQFFNRAKQGIAQQYAMMGRSTSPALDVALTDLASQLNEKRGQYLAGLSAQQYGGNKAAAISGYQDQQKQTEGRIAQSTDAQYKGLLDTLNRSREIGDYNTQATDYARNLDQYGGKNNWLDYLNAGVGVVNAGANVGKAFAMSGGA